jgi:hypothetical protein
MKFLKNNLYQILLFLIIVIIYVTNFKSGTYLIGWDNFNSELNPWLAVTQAFNAGWSNFRSFGLVAGMGYATDLWHALFIWLISFFLPQNIIRYFFQHFILLIGALGAFSLFRYLKLSPILSFVGSIYYVLNFGTAQIFALPYEPFSIFFGLFPWSILTYYQLQEHFDRRHLISFIIVNFFLSGAFYVQTMFLVYLTCLLGIFLANIKSHYRNSLKILLLIFVINSYWLLTQFYFLITTVSTVQNAKQTLLGWNVPYYQNLSHSNVPDFFTQIGYYTNFTNGSGGSYFDYWLKFFDIKFIIVLLIIKTFILIVGIFDGKHTHKRTFIILLLLHCIVFLPSLPVFSQVNDIIRNFPIVNQILRSPFSKFTMSLSLIFAFFFTLGIKSITHKIKHSRIITITSILLIISTNFPFFSGNFIAHEMQVKIPPGYFTLFKYFQQQPANKRIVILPETNIWGWYDYSWGYSGSGFLWHGIKQPIVSRSYDVWSTNSENYYWEISLALATNDPKNIISVLQKYRINYVILDNSLRNGSTKNRYFQTQIFNNLLLSSPEFVLVLKTPELSVYNLTSSPKSDIETTPSLPNIGPKVNHLNEDIAFNNFSNYQTNYSIPFDYYYPFLDLQTNSFDPHKLWTIKDEDSQLTISTSIPDSIDDNYHLNSSILFEYQDNKLISYIPKVLHPAENYNDPSTCGKHRSCWGYHYDSYPMSQSYLFQDNTTNFRGLPPVVYVVDHTKQFGLLETQLNSKFIEPFIIPAIAPDSIGFSINYQDQSYPPQENQNTTRPPSLYDFPEQSIKETFFQSSQPSRSSPTKAIIPNYSNPWLHIIKTSPEQYVILNQSFSSGWLAFYFEGLRPIFLKDHILVNNWANGWSIPSELALQRSSDLVIHILFWPQLLQFLGFILLISSFIFIFRKSETSHTTPPPSA